MPTIKASSSNQINKRAIETKCPVTFTLHKMGGRWKPLVINRLLGGPRRYGELKKAIPDITEKMLIQTLKEMEADKLIIRSAMLVKPLHVEYHLTECGEELKPVLLAMISWANKHNV